MKTKKITIEQAILTLNSIQACCKTEDGQPVYRLPFKLTYALARNIKKIQEALEPTQEANGRIFDGWPAENSEFIQRMKVANTDAELHQIKGEKQNAFDQRNEEWRKIIAEPIELEVYEVPKLNPEELEELAKSGLPATLIADLEPIGIFDSIEIA